MPQRLSVHVLTSIAPVVLSLKRRFAALEREEVHQCTLVKVPKHTEQSNNWAASNLKSGEETTLEGTLAARFVETS